MMALAMTGKVLPYKNDFGPMPGDVYRTPYPNPLHGISDEMALESLEKLFKTDIPAHRVAAIVIEPVQGEGGFYIASADYLKALRTLCDRHGILLIADEVQLGFARTGKHFALEHSGIEADILTTAKSLANGMPFRRWWVLPRSWTPRGRALWAGPTAATRSPVRRRWQCSTTAPSEVLEEELVIIERSLAALTT